MNLKNVKLRYDAQTHFECESRYPDGGLGEALTKNGNEGFDALVYAMVTMSRRARVYAEYVGAELPPVLDENELRMRMTLANVAEARKMIMAAMTAGIKSDDTEDDPDAERDLVLEEINEKKPDGD